MLKRVSLYNLTTGIWREKKELGGEIIFIISPPLNYVGVQVETMQCTAY